MRSLAFPARSAKRDVPGAVTKAFRDFEDQIGGRAQLIAVLSMAELTGEIEEVFRAIGDPDSDTLPLAEICYAHGLHPGQVVTAYHHAQMQMVKVLAMSLAAQRVPEVLQEIVKRALPHHDTCPACHGSGSVPRKKKPGRGRPPKPLPCEKCSASGQIYLSGEESQQDRILDLAKLLQKGGGVNILNQNVQTPSPSAGGGSTPIGQLHKAVAALLTPARTTPIQSPPLVVEATVLPETSSRDE